jgi:hypothetical protein
MLEPSPLTATFSPRPSFAGVAEWLKFRLGTGGNKVLTPVVPEYPFISDKKFN